MGALPEVQTVPTGLLILFGQLGANDRPIYRIVQWGRGDALLPWELRSMTGSTRAGCFSRVTQWCKYKVLTTPGNAFRGIDLHQLILGKASKASSSL